MLVERLAYKPLRHAPRISVLITAIGVSFFLEYTTMYFVSPTPRTFPRCSVTSPSRSAVSSSTVSRC